MSVLNVNVKYTRFMRYDRVPLDIPVHSHPYCEIVYYVSGTGYGKIGDLEYRYGPDTFVFIPTGVLHSEYAETVSSHYLIGLTYGGEFPIVPMGFYKDTSDGKLLDLFIRTQSELKTSQPFYEMYIDTLAEQILITIARKFSGMRNLVSSKLQTAIAFLNSYYFNDIDLKALAQSVYYSYDRFRHLFAEQTGLSPQQYLIRLRLDHAAQYLEQTPHSVSEIARLVGYHSDSALIIDFKKRYGKTPAQYRKKFALDVEQSNYDVQEK